MALGTVALASAISRSAIAPRWPATVCRICYAVEARRTPVARRSLTQIAHRPRPRQTRFLAAVAATASEALGRSFRELYWYSTDHHVQSEADHGERAAEPEKPSYRGAELSSLTNMLSYLENSKAKALSQRGVPTEDDIKAALQACKVVADYIMDESVKPQISHMVSELDSTASTLLSLDPAKAAGSTKSSEGARNSTISVQLQQMIDKISTTAYEVLASPNVLITPALLAQYVDVQSRLVRPETLPAVFQLSASKPVPRAGASGSVTYHKQNPNKPGNAINTEVIEKALDTAIEAKILDAAVGIVENSYSTTAFVRWKLLKHGSIPIASIVLTPFVANLVAGDLAKLQTGLELSLATNIAFWAILAYVGFTASIGIVSTMTANDQMKRVTWAPGFPLRKRWLREEERAALDKIACAWGYQEVWRQGEEEGADWEALREYIGQRGMILDRSELLEGME